MKSLLRLLGGFLFLLPLSLWAQETAPGTIEDKSNPLMAQIQAAHEAAKPAADEAVVYYYRPDGKGSDWGFWLWAVTGGDGNITWPKSSQLTVLDKVAYLKFKKDGSTFGTPVVGPVGTGVIARLKSGWTKDGADDRIIDLNVSNEWVIFSNDDKTYAYGPYKPTIDGARLTAPDKIQIDLSGRQALTVDPSSNGFVVDGGAGSPVYTVKDAFNTGVPDDRTKNFTKRVTLVLDRPVDLSHPITVSHKSYLAPAAVNTQALAAQLAETTVPPADYALGPIYDPAKKSVEFRLWAPLSSDVKVQVYKASGAASPDWTLPLVKNAATGVWTVTFNAVDPDGLFYDYRITSGTGTKIALDPYAPSMDAYHRVGAGRGAVINPAKALPAGGWEGATDYPLAKREDAVIYEASVRDFTISPDAGTKARPGSFLAFIEKLPYLKSLGITHIQLMPVLKFLNTDESKTAFEATGTASGNNYNWGYDPQNYFTPEGWFATDPADPYARVVELKTLIKEIHKAGMGVLLDVVYNHTASSSVLGDVVPGYYYRMNPDGSFRNNSGCGNDVATERVMARRLISDSLFQWANDYKVDGFRFDLMGLIDVDTILQSRARIAAIGEKSDILFEGEGWKMYNGPKTVKTMDQAYMGQTDKVAVFNDELRSLLKGGGMDDRALGFITGKPLSSKVILSNLLGKPQLNYKTPYPGNNLQYTEAHDNLTMHDNVSLNVGLSDQVPAQRAELAARLRLGNFLVLTAQGISFLHSGQESGRTKPKLNSTSEFLGDFIHNSYQSADNINQFNWKPYPEFQNLKDFTAGMIGIRRAYDAFRLGDAKVIEAAAKEIPGNDTLSLGWSLKGKDGTFTMLVNTSKAQRTFDVGRSLAGKKVLVAGDQASKDGLAAPQGFSIAGTVVTVEPLTAVMFEE
jgi:secreted pullulanase